MLLNIRTSNTVNSTFVKGSSQIVRNFADANENLYVENSNDANASQDYDFRTSRLTNGTNFDNIVCNKLFYV